MKQLITTVEKLATKSIVLYIIIYFIKHKVKLIE